MTRDDGTRRTRAMVRACEGISTAALEAGAVQQALAALKGIRPSNLSAVPSYFADEATFEIAVSAGELRAVFAALALLKGEQQ